MQCCQSVTIARDTLQFVFLLRLEGARTVWEMETLWLLQLSKYWLYIPPVLESFFCCYSMVKEPLEVDVPGMSFLLSDWSSVLREKRNESLNCHLLVFSWKTRSDVEVNASI